MFWDASRFQEFHVIGVDVGGKALEFVEFTVADTFSPEFRPEVFEAFTDGHFLILLCQGKREGD
jgi:hypothetical protein